ncbi:MAG: Na(+)-translocating NADH-quinone reductase subunit A [Cytophagales bacterium]|nr:Na(+)-translocating NADH-quinone reductase subunit A [Cytophagales bacterium]MDW8385024.1 Na(+)-translocating NADH-quinone reductase subunit A [Flammeovirgaceae bacterium]
MSVHVKLKKGFNINLAGKAARNIITDIVPNTYAVKASDVVGFERAKVYVTEGDIVKAGTPLFSEKQHENVMFTSPVSGEVISIVRGEKRKLLEVRILADKTIEYESFKRYSISEISSISRQEAAEQLCKSGVWTNIIQRPYGIIANPADKPKAIFISTFDTSPLAPDYSFTLAGQEKYFQVGIDILKKFTDGTVHVNINGKAEVSPVFSGAKNCQINKFVGKHPVGNVGVQIHHINPINKGDIVWTLNPWAVCLIGKLFLEGIYDASKIIAVAGSEVKNPQYYKTYVGASVSKFLENNLKRNDVRIISGNVLTGYSIKEDGYLGYYDHLITVIPEGNKSRFFLTEGWLAPTMRPSFHRAIGLLHFLNKEKEVVMDTSTNGEERAFVMTGVYEKVLPMDIYPLYLIKAILAEDYESMEALGIYELLEEDIALCEFIDVSKQDWQAILRKGLDMLRLS